MIVSTESSIVLCMCDGDNQSKLHCFSHEKLRKAVNTIFFFFVIEFFSPTTDPKALYQFCKVCAWFTSWSQCYDWCLPGKLMFEQVEQWLWIRLLVSGSSMVIGLSYCLKVWITIIQYCHFSFKMCRWYILLQIQFLKMVNDWVAQSKTVY